MTHSEAVRAAQRKKVSQSLLYVCMYVCVCLFFCLFVCVCCVLCVVCVCVCVCVCVYVYVYVYIVSPTVSPYPLTSPYLHGHRASLLEEPTVGALQKELPAPYAGLLPVEGGGYRKVRV
jgi:hypothetical protein